MARGGPQPGSGNPGYGKMKMIREGVEKLAPIWFEEIEKMLTSELKEDKKFALNEIGKLMGKMVPQQIEVTEPIRLLID